MNRLSDADKYKKLFNYLSRWVMLNENGMTVGRFLYEKGIKEVAIYGMGAFGKHLLFELREAGIDVAFAVDRRAEQLDVGVKFLELSGKDALPDVDLFIVTAIADYDEIERKICEVKDCSVVSLEEIIKVMERTRSK